MKHNRVLIPLLAAAVLVSTACDSDAPSPQARRSPSPASTPSFAPSPSIPQTTLQAWFTRDDRLFVTRRSGAGTPEGALVALFLGPTPLESESGVSSIIPGDTSLDSMSVVNGVARVNLNSERILDLPPELASLLVGQVVFTVTQFPDVEEAEVRLNGEAINGDLETRGPWSRDELEPLLPPIVVAAPGIGDEITSPVTIAGTANVFEATVSFRVLDQDGVELTRNFTTATCGSGCRGDYSARAKFEIDESQPGTVEVFEESAEDGSPIHVVSIPVTLLAD